MLVEAARRAEAAVKDMVSLVGAGSASCEDLREALAISRAFMAAGAVFQADAAASIAKRERQGDGGVEVLTATGGLSRREARSQVKTAQTLRQVPEVRSAVESGRVTQANAKQLAAVVEKTGAEAVASDGGLLERAETMRPDEFKRETRRWCAERDRDHGKSEHERQRSRRYLRISDTDDGMVCLHGEFDIVSGRQIANRLRAVAARMHSADKQNARAGVGAARHFDQCMADALHQVSANTDGSSGGGRGFADICVVAHVDDDTAELVAELPDGTKLPSSVLDTLTANARLTGLIYDRTGKPIWRTESARNATQSQRQILNAKWGGCFHCGAHFAICQPHHIEPVSRGGPTKIDNLVPACWDCHDLIHEHRWWILKRKSGNHTLHPPQRIGRGPARASDRQVFFRTEAEADPDPPDPDLPKARPRTGVEPQRPDLREPLSETRAAGRAVAVEEHVRHEGEPFSENRAAGPAVIAAARAVLRDARAKHRPPASDAALDRDHALVGETSSQLPLLPAPGTTPAR